MPGPYNAGSAPSRVVLVNPDTINDAGSAALPLLVRDTALHAALGDVRLGPGEDHVGEVGGRTALVIASFTRPADTTAYASGDLVANSTSAGSVLPVVLAIGRGLSGSSASGMIRRLRLRTTGASITNASFRVHFYRTVPITFANGDNAAWSTNQVANYVGAIDVICDRLFTDGISGNGVPNTGSEINFTVPIYYAAIEARAAYTPASGEVFTLELEVLQN